MAKTKQKNKRVNPNAFNRKINTSRTFAYSQGILTLSFNLDITNVQQLKGFKKLLEAGIEDINQALEELK